MTRKKLTLKDLAQMRQTKCSAIAVNSNTKGMKENPYTMEEVYFLIDQGNFTGGYVIDQNGLLSYWLGEAEVVAYNSESDEDVIYDFNSDFYVSFCQSYYNSDYNPFDTSASSNSDSYVNGTVSSIVDAFDSTGNALKKNPQKINYGTNGKFYFTTKSGRIFCGNQYVGTTSLNGVGTLISKYTNRANCIITAYNLIETYRNEGLEAALKETATTAGGIVGSNLGNEAGIWAGAMLGAKLGTSLGVWSGPVGAAIGGIIGGIIGGVSGQITGSYLVEISIEQTLDTEY